MPECAYCGVIRIPDELGDDGMCVNVYNCEERALARDKDNEDAIQE